jgi:hypothetical protein
LISTRWKTQYLAAQLLSNLYYLDALPSEFKHTLPTVVGVLTKLIVETGHSTTSASSLKFTAVPSPSLSETATTIFEEGSETETQPAATSPPPQEKIEDLQTITYIREDSPLILGKKLHYPQASTCFRRKLMFPLFFV